MVGSHSGLQVAVAVAEVADHAWAALERRHEHSAAALAREQDCVAAQGALAQARQENQRLRATIEQYEKALEALQIDEGSEAAAQPLDTKQVSSSSGCMTSGSSHESGVAKNNGQLWSFSVEIAGLWQFYDLLKKKLESPLFLEKLGGPHGAVASSVDASLFENVVGKPEEDASSWFLITENDFLKVDLKEERDGLGSDGYVLVSQEDILDGIACFIARYISTVPLPKKMDPKELQEAINKAFTELESKGKLRKLWDYGKFMYTAASWGATAVGLYRNPLIVRAALMAVWTSCCIMLQLLK